jgi:Lipocalin-like domain
LQDRIEAGDESRSAIKKRSYVPVQPCLAHQPTSVPLGGRKANSASVNQLTHALDKAQYDLGAIATDCDLASNRGRGTMPASDRILICAALAMGFLLQGSSCFGDDEQTKLPSTWKLVAFMTESVDNKVRGNVCDQQAEGYLTFTAAGRVFGFATTKGGEPLASTQESYNASRPIISYSGNYSVEGQDLAATIDSAWEDGWPRTDELHHYRLDGDKRLVETTHLRYPNAFGSKMISILIWERE